MRRMTLDNRQLSRGGTAEGSAKATRGLRESLKGECRSADSLTRAFHAATAAPLGRQTDRRVPTAARRLPHADCRATPARHVARWAWHAARSSCAARPSCSASVLHRASVLRHTSVLRRSAAKRVAACAPGAALAPCSAFGVCRVCTRPPCARGGGRPG